MQRGRERGGGLLEGAKARQRPAKGPLESLEAPSCRNMNIAWLESWVSRCTMMDGAIGILFSDALVKNNVRLASYRRRSGERRTRATE